MNLGGTGFIAEVPGIGELGGGYNINFATLLHYGDRVIGDKNQVKKIVIAAGYNDIFYSEEAIKNAILTTVDDVHKKFPKATIYLAMVGTNFLIQENENILLNVVDKGYRAAANARDYIEYIPYTGTDYSVSYYLQWFSEYHKTYERCPLEGVCYYSTDGIHPTPVIGQYIGDVIANYLKSH